MRLRDSLLAEADMGSYDCTATENHQPWQSADAPRTAGEALTGPPMSPDPQDTAGFSQARDIPDGLRRALIAAAATRDYTAPGLHEEVCDYVRDLRDRGLPPETVVIAMKSAVRDATLGLAPYQVERRHSAELLDRVVRWCIEEYYGGGSADRSPS
jgi:hypothetical protein